MQWRRAVVVPDVDEPGVTPAMLPQQQVSGKSRQQTESSNIRMSKQKISPGVCNRCGLRRREDDLQAVYMAEVGRVVQAGPRMHRIEHQDLMRRWSNEKKLVGKRKRRELSF
jgi:hypothetical protein